MAIYRDGKKVNMVYYGSIALKAIYRGATLIWKAVQDFANSCFGSGRWIDDEPWLDDDVWRDEP